MEKTSKCQCKSCGVNVEFDAKQLAPDEVRNGPCPVCGIDMFFFNAKKDADISIKRTTLEGNNCENFKNKLYEFIYQNGHRARDVHKAIIALCDVSQKTKNSGSERITIRDIWLSLFDWNHANSLIMRIKKVKRINLYLSFVVPVVWLFLSFILGIIIESSRKERLAELYQFGAPGTSVTFVCVTLGFFFVPATIYFLFKTGMGQCIKCRKFDAMRKSGRSKFIGTKDTTQKEMRGGIFQEEFGKPEAIITYLQDVKVQKHTSAVPRRCIFCGYNDYEYSSYTTKL